MRVYLFLFFFFSFPRDYRIDPFVLECRLRAHSSGNEKFECPFLSDLKNRKAPRPPPMLIFSPKSPDQNSEIAILFSIVEKPNCYAFGDELLLHSLRGRACMLQTLASVNTVMVIGKCTDAFGGFFGWGRG